MFLDITEANADLIAQVLCLTQHVTHLIETDKRGMGGKTKVGTAT
jgi:hypothetical protein